MICWMITHPLGWTESEFYPTLSPPLQHHRRQGGQRQAQRLVSSVKRDVIGVRAAGVAQAAAAIDIGVAVEELVPADFNGRPATRANTASNRSRSVHRPPWRGSRRPAFAIPRNAAIRRIVAAPG